MDISIQRQTDTQLVFTLRGVSAAYANTLRRLMMGEVPTMAIEDVTFQRNDSVLYDEVLAHRLGLVVLTTDLDSYKMSSVCDCKGAGCPQCQCKLSLQKEGPCKVYAKDLVSKDPATTPVYPDTLLVTLNEGQKLNLEAVAVLGTNKEHSKWNPGLIWYYNEPSITVNNKAKDFETFKAKFPPQIFTEKGTIDKKLINTPALVDACIGVNKDIVDITYDKESFVFTVESFGALNPKEIVQQAMEVYNDQLNIFERLIDAKE